MDTGTCIGRESQDHEVAKVIQEGQQSQGEWILTGILVSAEARLLSSGGATDAVSSGSSDGFSVVVGFWAGVLVEMDEVVVLRSK